MSQTAIELVEQQTKPITTTTTVVDKLCKVVFKRYNRPREGEFIHASELSLCQRLSVFRRLDPKDIDWRAFNYYIFGESYHFICQELAREYPEFKTEKEVKYKDIIVGHIDLFDEQENIVYEIKTVRKAKLDRIKPHQIKQLKMYMALTGASKGVLWHLMLLNYDSNPFVLVDITMTEKERQDLLIEMEIQAKYLKMSIDLKDPSQGDDVMYDKTLNWLCDYCPYTKQCMPMIHRKPITMTMIGSGKTN